MADFSRLDRLAAMQNAPLGTFSSMRRPSPVASQYKRQASLYNQASRNLRRASREAARMGDVSGVANAAKSMLDLQDRATSEGMQIGGIRRAEDVQANTAAREQAYAQEASDLETKSRLDRQFGSATLGRTVNPNATARAGRGTPIAQTMEARNTPTRVSAALDMLEGSQSLAQGGIGQLNRGREAARSLGVAEPDTILSGDRNLKFRQTLDTALGQAKTPEEVSSLRERGAKAGISPQAFDRRARWWESNR